MDQFRGYTVAGMFLVNFLGGFAAVHPVLKHHNTYCSYADTIMPQFFFAVGFALRLVMLRHPDYGRAVRRALGLVLVGVVVYHLDGNYRRWEEMERLGAGGVLGNAFWRSPFQALVHIGVTSVWVLPVVARGARARLLFAITSFLLHLGFSAWFWYDLLQAKRVIDGGALGFLSWTLPVIAGTFAHDWARADGAITRLGKWGVTLMLAGYGLACLNGGGRLAPPPFWPPVAPVDLWTMSQRAGSVSYLTFASGFSLAVYALFVWLVDQKQKQWELFAVLGQNALAGYLIHMWVSDAVDNFGPKDSPLWWALTLFVIFFGLSWWMVRYLNRHQMFLRL
jgi:predicted acyltransferase